VTGETGGGLLPSALLGVATSGYQVEGGFNGPGEPANNWATWERVGRVAPSGRACGFWQHPEEALDRAASLGADAFRLSVEWARTEPAAGEVDDDALDRYAVILDGCAARGLEPVVTLHHFTHPWWLGDEFWLTPGAPERFAAHVSGVAEHLAGRCRRWVTVNEPNVAALAGWMVAAHPPGRHLALSDAFAVVDNLLAAHVLAYEAIHRADPEATVTVAPSASSVYELDRLWTDLLCARSLGVARDDLDGWTDERRRGHDAAYPPRSSADALARRAFAAASPFGPDGPAPGRRALRRPSPRRAVGAVYEGPHERPLDAVAFSWYDPVTPHLLVPPGRRSSGGRHWAATAAAWDVRPRPEDLAAWCGRTAALYPGLEVWVAENGMATLIRNGRFYPRRDGWDRPAYLRAHLAALVGAADAGVPVGAYFHWSLVDNYEWGSFEPRFGLFGLDRDRGERGVRWLETDSAGLDAPGAWRRLVDGIRAGDRSVFAG